MLRRMRIGRNSHTPSLGELAGYASNLFLLPFVCVCLTTFLSVCLSVGLSVCRSVCLSVGWSVCLSFWLSVWFSVCQSGCASICLSLEYFKLWKVSASVSCHISHGYPFGTLSASPKTKYLPKGPSTKT